MSQCVRDEVNKGTLGESVMAANTEAPPTEESQSLRDTIREMVSELVEYRWQHPLFHYLFGQN